MNEIWEQVLANSFSGIHKSKIICSVEAGGLQFWRFRLGLLLKMFFEL
jgi:hypothetical protein